MDCLPLHSIQRAMSAAHSFPPVPKELGANCTMKVAEVHVHFRMRRGGKASDRRRADKGGARCTEEDGAAVELPALQVLCYHSVEPRQDCMAQCGCEVSMPMCTTVGVDIILG